MAKKNKQSRDLNATVDEIANVYADILADKIINAIYKKLNIEDQRQTSCDCRCEKLDCYAKPQSYYVISVNKGESKHAYLSIRDRKLVEVQTAEQASKFDLGSLTEMNKHLNMYSFILKELGMEGIKFMIRKYSDDCSSTILVDLSGYDFCRMNAMFIEYIESIRKDMYKR